MLKVNELKNSLQPRKVVDLKNFTITRNFDEGLYNIGEVFSGLADAKCLYKVYGSRNSLKLVLAKAKIKIVEKDCYMFVDDSEGCIVVGKEHLKKSEGRTLYLDIIHELVHIKQLMDGKDIYDERYDYVDRQTEFEAYKVVVDEARILGMHDAAIIEYLNVEWVSVNGLKHLANRLGVSSS